MTDSDLSEIPTDLIRTVLCETIEKKLKSKKYKVTLSSASKAGESNFIGIVYRATFAKEGDNNPEKLILKVAPQLESRRTQFKSRELFLQEIYVYNQILPYFQKFEESKGLAIEKSGFNEYPKCYQTIKDEPSECLFLEDLSVRNFSIIDRYVDEVTADHVFLVMKALAKFHAISFALKDQQPEKFHEFASNIKELFIRNDDVFIREFFNKQFEAVFRVLNEDDDAILVAKVKRLLKSDVVDIAVECLDLQNIGAGAIITHGDTWQNNTMFRYNESGKPIEVSLLDWQISRYSSPVIDIVYFMFCCTTKELRDAHYDNFLKVYHDNLFEHIRRLGSDPEKLFPVHVMREHFRKCAKYGLILATVLLPMITTDRGLGVDLDELAEKFKDQPENNDDIDVFKSFISESSQNKFNKRLRDVVIDMERLGYI